MTYTEERSLLLSNKAATILGCCRSYKFVPIHSKGALVALLLASMFAFQSFEPGEKEIVKPYIMSISQCFLCLMFPVLGFYTDVRFGRYKTLIALTVVRVFLSAMPLLLSILDIIYDGYSTQFEIKGIVHTIHDFIYNPVSVSFRIIIFTFGLDQLLDAPSSEMSVFIHWRYFAYAFIDLIRYTPSIFLRPSVWNFASRIVCFLLYIACLLSLLCCHRWLNLQPQVTNPLHLIARVVRYAVKNSQPRRRSAFTYWQEEAPSRLDMGKEKFGGPFTEEQVEDVKTVFRLVPLLLLATTVNIITMYPVFTLHLSQNKLKHMDDFFTNPAPVVNVEVMVIVFIHICVVFPFYHRHHPSMLRKIGIGCFACVAVCAIFLVIDTATHVTSNRSIACMFNNSTNSSQEHDLPLSRHLLHASYFLQALGRIPHNSCDSGVLLRADTAQHEEPHLRHYDRMV